MKIISVRALVIGFSIGIAGINCAGAADSVSTQNVGAQATQANSTSPAADRPTHGEGGNQSSLPMHTHQESYKRADEKTLRDIACHKSQSHTAGCENIEQENQR